MIDWPAFFQGAHLIANWYNLVLINVIGLWIGLVLGAIPGLTGSLGIAILTPVTFLMDPLTALNLLTAVYTGGLTGGGITAILINVPGAPAAIATTFDGYPMTRMGKQNEALGLQLAASVIGGTASYIFLLFFLRPLATLALQFGPAEMLFLTIFVLVVVGAIRGGSFSRAIFAGIFGLLVGTVGTSEATGVVRGSMGFEALEDGIPHIACIIGLFAIPEMLDLITREFIVDMSVAKGHDIKKLMHGVLTTFRYVRTLIRSALIGIFIGILPAAGSTVACLLSYSHAKRGAKPGQRFGEGEPEGVVAAETANNASEGGAMSILLALGIPGSGSTAILVAAFMLHGLVPGPRLFEDNAPLIYGLILLNLVQNGVLIFCWILLAFYMAEVVLVPTKILAPTLMAVMAMGAYSARNLFFDVYLLFFFGVLGWFFRRYDFPAISFIIGYILGGNLDMEVYRFAALFGTDLTVFLRRPISGALALLTFITLGLQVRRYLRERREALFGAGISVE